MKILKSLAVLSLLAVISISMTGCLNHCSWLGGVKGSGNIISETRQTAPFKYVLLEGSADIYVTQSDKLEVRVTADDNILPIIETSVQNDQLTISYKESVRNAKVKIYLSMPEIGGFDIEGSGDIRGENQFKCNSLQLIVNGSGDINLDAITKNIRLEINGSGDAKFKGSSDNFKAKVDGSGDIDASNLISKSADLVVSGSGNIKANVVESLRAEVNGSGDILYLGEPSILKSAISGSGSIRKIK